MGGRFLRRSSITALIQSFESVVDEEKAERDAVRMLRGHFDLNDFFEQVRLLKEMGPLTETAEEIPGLAEALPDGGEIGEGQLDRIGAMVSSMTEDERRHPERFVVTNLDALASRLRRAPTLTGMSRSRAGRSLESRDFRGPTEAEHSLLGLVA